MTNAPLIPIHDSLPTPDDGQRPIHGVVASLRVVDPGTMCLAFDDVESSVETRNKDWTFRFFYTHEHYPAGIVRDMALTDEQYRDIGIALMTRLVAIEETSSKNQGEAGGT